LEWLEIPAHLFGANFEVSLPPQGGMNATNATPDLVNSSRRLDVWDDIGHIVELPIQDIGLGVADFEL